MTQPIIRPAEAPARINWVELLDLAERVGVKSGGSTPYVVASSWWSPSRTCAVTTNVDHADPATYVETEEV